MLHLEHSAILLTFIKLPFVIKIFVLSIFEWPSFSYIYMVLWTATQYIQCCVYSRGSQYSRDFNTGVPKIHDQCRPKGLP